MKEVTDSRTISHIGRIFLAVGIIMMLFGVIMFTVMYRAEKNGVEVTAEISRIESYKDKDGDTKHRVYVNYTYGTETYTDVKINTYSLFMYEGGRVTVIVDPQNPAKIMTKGDSLFSLLIFELMGPVFLFFGWLLR